MNDTKSYACRVAHLAQWQDLIIQMSESLLMTPSKSKLATSFEETAELVLVLLNIYDCHEANLQKSSKYLHCFITNSSMPPARSLCTATMNVVLSGENAVPDTSPKKLNSCFLRMQAKSQYSSCDVWTMLASKLTCSSNGSRRASCVKKVYSKATWAIKWTLWLEHTLNYHECSQRDWFPYSQQYCNVSKFNSCSSTASQTDGWCFGRLWHQLWEYINDLILVALCIELSYAKVLNSSELSS